MRDITRKDVDTARKYLERALVELAYDEYSKVRRLCEQVQRKLWRKEKDKKW